MVSTRAHDRGGPGVVGDGMPRSVLHVLKVEERESVSLGAYYIIEQMASINTWHVSAQKALIRLND